MKLSDEGVRLIKSFEGYLTKQADGSCTAYLCPARVPTIGWGCTEGVKLGMRWTMEEAEAGLRRELAKFETVVNKHVTVDLNQNEFDALVSFAYNVGEGGRKKVGFSNSTLLKKLNRGDRNGAANEFHKWKRGGGRVLRGLVSRRAREAALFLKPVEQPTEPYMPQEVTPPPSKAVPVAAGATVAGGAIAVPAAPDMSIVTGWQGAGETLSTATSWAFSQPVMLAVIVCWIAGMVFLPKLAGRFGWQQS